MTRFNLVLGPIQHFVVIDVIMFLVGVVGSLFNSILLYITLKKQGKSIDIVLIGIIAMFDMLVLSLVMSSILMNWMGIELHLSSTRCVLSAIIMNSATILTPALVAQLSIMRYLIIVRGWRVNLLAWAVLPFSLLLMGTMLFFWRCTTSPLFILPTGIYCTPQYWGEDVSSQLFGALAFIIVFPSLVAVPFCYFRIIRYYFMIVGPASTLGDAHTHIFLKRSTLKMIAINLGYTVTILPELTHVLISVIFGVERSGLSDGIVMTLLLCITWVNPLFTLLMHEETRYEFYTILDHWSKQLIPRGVRQSCIMTRLPA